MARFITGLFGGQKQTQQPATALRVNTSLQGVPIALVLGGQTRIAGNVIDYFNFFSQAAPNSGGGKGGVGGGGSKGQSGQTQYFVTFVMGLAHGQVTADAVFVNGSQAALQDTGTTQQLPAPFFNQCPYEIFHGDFAQQPWSYAEDLLGGGGTITPRGLAYRGISYIGFENYPLGSSPTLPNLNFLARNLNNWGFIPGQPDGDPSICFSDFLTNADYGVGLPASCIGSLAAWQAYCLAIGFGVSPALVSSTQAASFLNDLCTATNAAPCWQDGQLTVVPYGDQAITAGQINTVTEAHQVPTATNNAPQIQTSFVATYVSDGGVTYLAGANLVKVSVFNPGVSPAVGQYYELGGYYYFNNADIGQQILITYNYAASASYIPDTQNLYDFTIDDCLPNEATIGAGAGDKSSPFVVVTKPRDQMLTSLKLEYLDRTNAFNPVDLEVKDGAAIIAFGRERPSDIKQLHFFCLAAAAQISATLQLQRALVPRTFQWTVGRHFMMILKLMGIGTITDPGQGLARQPVRMIEFEESGDFSYTITAEEFLGTASAPAFGTQAPLGAGNDFNADPGGINPPLIFEPTDEFAGGNYVAAAVSGQNPALYGGAFVWVATSENGSYTRMSTPAAPARMGVLTAPLATVPVNPNGETLDQTNILSIDLTESDGVLGTSSVQDAVALADPCYVDGEIVCYADATLTGTNTYNLSYLVRGTFGTEAEIVTHAAGAMFARLDSAIAMVPFNAAQIGQTIYIKFQPFNIFGGGAPSLADCPVYPYTIQGSALASPLPVVQNPRIAYDVNLGFTAFWWDQVSDFRQVDYEIRLGPTWDTAVILGRLAHPPFRVPGNGTFWIKAHSQPVAGLDVYSETAVDVVVSGAVITQNIVKTIDLKALNWPGTFTGGAGVDSGLNAIRSGAGNILADTDILGTPDILSFGGAQSGGYWPGANAFIDVGYVANVSIAFQYAPTGILIGQNILALGNILNQQDILGAANTKFIGVVPVIRFANTTTGGDLYALGDLYYPGYTDLYDSTAFAWGPWQSFSPGSYQNRYFEFGIVLNTSDPGTFAYNLAAVITATVPARIDSYAPTTSNSADITITFQPTGAAAAPFNAGPGPGNLPAIMCAIINAQAGDDFIITALSLSAISFKVLNGGARVVRNLNLTAEGY